jgi:homoserine dehydrogenase
MQAKIGLFGFGVVGQGIYNILAHKNGSAPGHIARICVRDRQKARPLPLDRFSFDPEDILGDPSITHVVEVTDRPDEAFQIVSRALRAGKSVISANKRMLAERLPELTRILEDSGGELRYEASVGGSIPIFSNLEHYYAHDKILGIRGVLNGSTNYILTRMTEDGTDFPEALAMAQKLGFAESAPSLDVDAHDPTYKLTLLAHRALGIQLDPSAVLRLGIRHISDEDIRFALDKGMKIKLLATAGRQGQGGFQAHVLPSMVSPKDPFYHLENEYNSIEIRSLFTDTQWLVGKGAGSLPTGFAVLSDLNASLSGRTWAATRPTAPVSNDWSGTVTLYLRSQHPEALRLLDFEEVLETRQSPKGEQVLGRAKRQNLAERARDLEALKCFVAVGA